MEARDVLVAAGERKLRQLAAVEVEHRPVEIGTQDGGMDVAERFILNLWGPDLDTQRRAPQHPKSTLQELAAARAVRAPTYEVVSRTGAHHAPKFTIKVSVPTLGEATAEGASKQEAETAAAAALLKQLK